MSLKPSYARVVLAATVAALSMSSRADVVLRPLTGPPPQKSYISIEGVISKGDDRRLIDLLSGWQGDVSLNTGGGDVQAAMAIGRELRNAERAVIVLPGATCASACVFVLAGAPTRVIFGIVAIHRPFIPDDNSADPAEQKLRYKILGSSVRAYLSEMNANPSLYDDMVRVSSARARPLTKDELERYGLSGTDPFINEAQITESAASLRISKAEYISRQQRKEAECVKLLKRDPDEYGKCAVAVEYGITREEYARRDRLAERECASESSRAKWVSCHTRITRGF